MICPTEREHEEYAELTDLDGATRFCPRCGMRWEGGNGEPVTVTAYPVTSACERLVKWANAQPPEAWTDEKLGAKSIRHGALVLYVSCDHKMLSIWRDNEPGGAQRHLRKQLHPLPTAPEVEAKCAEFLAVNEARPE
jgi:hypothetical protein